MATPRYPNPLPMPKTMNLTAANQHLANSPDDPYADRRRTIVPGATVNATFRFLRSQYKEFIEWYRTDLLMGHKWFTMYLPSAAGIVPHVVRFIKPPQGSMSGHRYWELSAQLEVRERQFDNSLRVTSRPYAIEIEEDLAVSGPLASILNYRIGVEEYLISAQVMGITLRNTLHYLPTTDEFAVEAEITSIELRDVRIILPLTPEEFSVSATMQGITLDELAVHADSTDELAIAATVTGITLS